MTSSCAPTFLLAFLILPFFAVLTQAQTITEAVAVLVGPGINGTIYFRQTSTGSTVTISGSIQGLAPNTPRGFHVHEFGNLAANCTSTGAHFNPFNKRHGGPGDVERHVGDLGNIQTDPNGNFSLTDNIISLSGPTSILGRAVVLHNATDDLGRVPGNNGSTTTGNAGGRSACGVIGISVITNASQLGGPGGNKLY